MRRRHRTRAALATAVTVGAVVIGASMAAADTVPAELVEVGWWTSRPGATEQEGNGFEVAAGIDGSEQSVAAMRFRVHAGEVTAFDVVLHEARVVGAEFGGLAVCTTGPGWLAEDPGELEQAPERDCSTQVQLTRSTSGSWLGTLAALVPEGGEVSLMVLPLHESPVGVGSPFIVTVGEVEITRAEGTPPTTTTTTTDLSAPGADVSSDSVGSPPPPSDTPGAVSVDPGPAAPVTPAVEETDPPAEGEPEEDEFFTLGPLEDEEGDSKPWARLLVLLPLSAGVGAGAVHLRRFLQSRGVRIA